MKSKIQNVKVAYCNGNINNQFCWAVVFVEGWNRFLVKMIWTYFDFTFFVSVYDSEYHTGGISHPLTKDICSINMKFIHWNKEKYQFSLGIVYYSCRGWWPGFMTHSCLHFLVLLCHCLSNFIPLLLLFSSWNEAKDICRSLDVCWIWNISKSRVGISSFNCTHWMLLNNLKNQA